MQYVVGQIPQTAERRAVCEPFLVFHELKLI